MPTTLSMQRKRADHRNGGAHRTPLIATAGEVFDDGASIEVVREFQSGIPQLLLWNGTKETTGLFIEHNGCRYKPLSLNSTLLRELTLPTRCRPHGTTRELLADICKLAVDFA